MQLHISLLLDTMPIRGCLRTDLWHGRGAMQVGEMIIREFRTLRSISCSTPYCAQGIRLSAVLKQGVRTVLRPPQRTTRIRVSLSQLSTKQIYSVRVGASREDPPLHILYHDDGGMDA